MKSFFFCLLICFSLNILSKAKESENKIINKTENNIENKNNIKNEKSVKNKNNNPSNITTDQKLNSKSNKTSSHKQKRKSKPKKGEYAFDSNSTASYNTSFTPNIDVINLNDLTFDMVLQKGNHYRWLVILYSETCGHCEAARREVRKLLPQYRNNNTIRFGEIEINRNPMTNMRFNIEGVPYIFLLQNNTIYELDNYANQNNLIKFIDTIFEDVKDELKPFPPMVPIYKFAWQIIVNIFVGITNGVNEMLFDAGYEFEFTPILLLLSIIGFFAFIVLLEYLCCLRFCPDDDKKKSKVKNKEEGKEEAEEENNEEEDEKEDNKNEDEKIEEEKIKRERNKEKEEKEEKERESNKKKKNDKKDNNAEKDNFKNKKKKKE